MGNSDVHSETDFHISDLADIAAWNLLSYPTKTIYPYRFPRMKTSFLFRSLIILSLILVNVGCDQVSKSIVRENLDYHEEIELVSDRVILTKVENTGAFLSLGSTLSPIIKTILLLVLPVLVITLSLGFVLFTPNIHQSFLVGICFIIGGGIGNTFDRIAYQSVTDFMHIDFYLFRTGIFNFADVSISLGVLIALYAYYRTKGELTASAP